MLSFKAKGIHTQEYHGILRPDAAPLSTPGPRLMSLMQAVSFDEFYQHLIKGTAEKRLVFVPGQKIRLKEGHKVVM